MRLRHKRQCDGRVKQKSGKVRIGDAMKNNLLLYVSLLLLLAADAFCDSPFKVSVGNVLIDKNTVPYKIDNSSHSYVCDFIGNDKIECYTVDYDEYGSVMSEKEYVLELERKSEDSAVLKIFGRDGSLQKEHQIAFLAENTIKINRDTYVLRGDSYKELKNNVLKNGQIKELLEFLKATLFFYHDFAYFNFLILMPQKSNVIKYFILSASLHFSSGQSSWIYDYEARYSYKGDLIEELTIVDEDGETYLEQKLEEKTDDYLVYKLFKRVAEGVSMRSYFFIDLVNNMTQESGIYLRSCYEYSTSRILVFYSE